MFGMKSTLCTSIGFSIAVSSAAVATEETAVAYVQGQVIALQSNTIVLKALKDSNMRNSGLDEASILTQDEKWRAEIGASSAPLITSITSSPASDALRAIVDASGGQITEIILMDVVGLNAAVSSITSDYWQGDEEKYSETFLKGANAVHVNEIEFDESANIYQRQISATLVDPSTGVPVGAVTFGLDAAAFN